MSLPLRPDETLSNLPWPEFGQVAEIQLAPGDVYVACGGFEDRAFAALGSATNVGRTDCIVAGIRYLPHYEENRFSELRELSSRIGARFVGRTYNRHLPAGSGELFADLFDAAEGRIWVDVSGMSKLLIAQLIVVLARPPRALRGVSIVYSEAKTYPPNQETFEQETREADPLDASFFLSEGVQDVEVVPELGSLAMPGPPVHLVLFPSFNPDQLSSLQGAIQPSSITAINGSPPASGDAWRLEAIRILNNVDSLPNTSETTTSTLDYRETLRALLEIYSAYNVHHRLVVSPTGSKMQSVAVGLFRACMTDTQVAYPVPRVFTNPKEHTRGFRAARCLPLESLSLLFDLAVEPTTPSSRESNEH